MLFYCIVHFITLKQLAIFLAFTKGENNVHNTEAGSDHGFPQINSYRVLKTEQDSNIDRALRNKDFNLYNGPQTSSTQCCIVAYSFTLSSFPAIFLILDSSIHCSFHCSVSDTWAGLQNAHVLNHISLLDLKNDPTVAV